MHDVTCVYRGFYLLLTLISIWNKVRISVKIFPMIKVFTVYLHFVFYYISNRVIGKLIFCKSVFLIYKRIYQRRSKYNFSGNTSNKPLKIAAHKRYIILCYNSL